MATAVRQRLEDGKPYGRLPSEHAGTQLTMIRGLSRIARCAGTPRRRSRTKNGPRRKFCTRTIHRATRRLFCATPAAQMSRIWIDILDIEAGGFQSSSELSRGDFGAEPVGIQCSCNMDMRSDFYGGVGLPDGRYFVNRT